MPIQASYDCGREAEVGQAQEGARGAAAVAPRGPVAARGRGGRRRPGVLPPRRPVTRGRARHGPHRHVPRDRPGRRPRAGRGAHRERGGLGGDVRRGHPPRPPRAAARWRGVDRQPVRALVRRLRREGATVFEDIKGNRVEVPLGPDGLPSDKGPGWSRVDLDTQGESRESWEGY